MPRVYISYRPEDSSRNEVAVIHQQLSNEFGADNVLVSTGSNMEITTHLQKLVRSCDVMLVVIGRWWMNMLDEEGNPLLNDPYDPIHVELDAGLKTLMVVKVLVVDAAPIPKTTQLPPPLQSLLNKDIIETPDDLKLNRVLEELIQEITMIPTGIMAEEHGIALDDPDLIPDAPPSVNQTPAASTLAHDVDKPNPAPTLENNPTVSLSHLMAGLMGIVIFTLIIIALNGNLRGNSPIPDAPGMTLPAELAVISRDNVADLEILGEIDSIPFLSVFSRTNTDFIYINTQKFCIYGTLTTQEKYCIQNEDFDDIIAADANIVVTVNRYDQKVRVYDMEAQKYNTFSTDGIPLAAAVDSNNQHVIIATDTMLNVWDYVTNTRTLIPYLEAEGKPPVTVTMEIYQATESLVIGMGQAIQVWDLSTLELQATRPLNILYIYVLGIPDNPQIFVVTFDLSVYYLSMDQLNIIKRSEFLQRAYSIRRIKDLYINQEGILMIQTYDTIEFWDALEQEKVHTMGDFFVPIYGIKLSPNGNLIALKSRIKVLFIGVAS